MQFFYDFFWLYTFFLFILHKIYMFIKLEENEKVIFDSCCRYDDSICICSEDDSYSKQDMG